MPPRNPNDPITQDHKDLAASGQKLVEDLITRLVISSRTPAASENLVLSGGVALNGLANDKIAKSQIYKNIYVPPAPGDDGAALGAALHISKTIFNQQESRRIPTAYLGPSFSETEIEMFLKAEKIPYRKLEDNQLLAQTAQALANGQVIGWFQGSMEFGPRALGNRSILADPRHPEMKDVLNRKVKFREDFRPFAPVVKLENAKQFFNLSQGEELPFMSQVVGVLPGAIEKLGATTHIDGTSRVQTLRPDQNIRLHNLLSEFERLTGLPVLLNTSFNLRGEPIVCTPQDAYQTFCRSGLDCLVVGNFFIESKTSLAEQRVPDLSLTVSQETLEFYQHLPFNYFSCSVDMQMQLRRKNPIKEYRPLHKFLKTAKRPLQILDVGAGSGWFLNSLALNYNQQGLGIDFNPVALKQARSVASLIANANNNIFIDADLFTFKPESQSDLVNCLGVAHHTDNLNLALKRITSWVKPGGYLHLGLYNKSIRRPFLNHFSALQRDGYDEESLFKEFAALLEGGSDPVHLKSWFRDQVLHPYETQHSYSEIHEILTAMNFEILACSLDQFKSLPSQKEMARREESLENSAQKALAMKGRYVPGFFVVWARRLN